MSNHLVRLAEKLRAHTDTSVGGRASAEGTVGEVGDPMFAGPVAVLTAPAEPLREATATPEVPETAALYGATRLDSQSFCARVTASRTSGVVLPVGFTFRVTLTRAADATGADVAVSDWLDLAVVDRFSDGDRLPALPGDFAHIGAGETWTYDVRLTTPLVPGRGRTMRFAESPTGRGWHLTFAELDENGEPMEPGFEITF
ncbi:hypothetical protein [Nocardioides bigeumensis]|jgi:hypothetical protein|uniref:hypothetical protein n=1 Tax=Nocardioides bigeumensis TaxID=433657 RepID=UPI0031DE712C